MTDDASDRGLVPDPLPDTKDWTWVLTRPCPDCGLAAGDVDPASIATQAFVAAEEWVAILRSSPAVDVRPSPGVWSPLEYGAHVRDVYRLFEERLTAMLTQDDPTFPDWDQDATARDQRYDLQDAEVVADELEAVAETFVARLGAVTEEQWSRPGHRSNGSAFTVETLSQYFLHDVVHHLWDVTGQQDQTSSLLLDPDGSRE